MNIFQKSVGLEPSQGGGVCIPPETLEPADIIVSTTSAATSAIIRIDTFSAVSHAALYCGGGQVIEAIAQGVVQRSLGLALADDVLAVAYRNPKVTPAIASAIIGYAKAQVGKGYAYFGAALAGAGSTLVPVFCNTIGSGTQTFFCSQLVVEAFKQGGAPLTTRPSGCITPAGLASIADQLEYVGHLLGEPTWFPVISG